MTDKLTSPKFEDLTHQYHDKYRTTGIALCISLATFASAECWFFYGLFLKTENSLQSFFCSIVIISAISLFVSSFVLQFLNYYGIKEMAQSFFYAYKLSNGSKDESLKKEMEEKKERKWDKALNYFSNADIAFTWMKWLTIVNFIPAFFYIVRYLPNPS